MRKTKIICTLGPACSDEVLRGLVRGGMDLARFNFSHGDHASQAAMLARLRAACAQEGRQVPVLLDTRGPEVRVCNVPEQGISLAAGEMVCLCPDHVPAPQGAIAVTHPRLAERLSVGCDILIDDGQLALRVTRIEGDCVYCVVGEGGLLKNRKGLNVPQCDLALPFLNERDMSDLRFGVEQGFDCVAASFVRCADDVRTMRAYLQSLGHALPIIAKIENRDGVEAMEEIIQTANGVMVARGDLGVEIPAAQVPAIQKEITTLAIERGKPVIIATQMMDSMCHNPRPTRAEVSDVAQAVFDMADCVMLSGETASGSYPLKSLAAMRDTLEEAESAMAEWMCDTTPNMLDKALARRYGDRPRRIYAD